MRRYNEPIRVQANRKGIPLRLRWRESLFVVEQIENHWRWAGKWWLTGNPQRRVYFRVSVKPSARHNGSQPSPLYRSRSLEIYREGKQWVLSQLYD